MIAQLHDRETGGDTRSKDIKVTNVTLESMAKKAGVALALASLIATARALAQPSGLTCETYGAATASTITATSPPRSGAATTSMAGTARAMRGPSGGRATLRGKDESYSDVILRLARGDAGAKR